MIQELIWIVGPLVVAAMITLVSPSGAVLVSAGVCVVGTTLFITSPRVRAGGGVRSTGRRRSAVASPELRAMLWPVAMMGAAIGLIDVGIPSLALHDGSRASTGVLLALWSVGSLCGGLWYGGVAWRIALPDRYRWLLTAAVACVLPLVFARTIPEGMVASFLAGVTIAPVFSCQYALVGRAVTPGIGDRGVHLGGGGADARAVGRLGAQRRADRRDRGQRAVRGGVRGDGRRGAGRGQGADRGAGRRLTGVVSAAGNVRPVRASKRSQR